MFWPTALKNKVPSLRLWKLPTLSSAILFLLQSARFICAPVFRQEDKIIFFGYIKYSIPRETCPGFRCCHLWRSRALCHPGSSANQSTCDATHLSKCTVQTWFSHLNQEFAVFLYIFVCGFLYLLLFRFHWYIDINP